jgi:hypothetical protein
MNVRLIPSLAVLGLLICAPLAVRADDFGPHRDLAEVRDDARRLLAQRVRAAGVDPAKIAISGVVVAKDQALLSWDDGKNHGVMGLVRYLDRWWDALDKDRHDDSGCRRTTLAFPLQVGFSQALLQAAAAHNDDVKMVGASSASAHGCAGDIYVPKPVVSVLPRGATKHEPRSTTSGYDVTFSYAANDAPPGAAFSLFYVRPPSAAEMLPSPMPPSSWGGPNSVMFFSFTIASKAPVRFQAGSTLDVWFPFVLDDSVTYFFSTLSGTGEVGPLKAKAYDNALHFVLPAFTAKPGDEFMGEIDAEY